MEALSFWFVCMLAVLAFDLKRRKFREYEAVWVFGDRKAWIFVVFWVALRYFWAPVTLLWMLVVRLTHGLTRAGARSGAGSVQPGLE